MCFCVLNSNYIATGSNDKTIKIWDISNSENTNLVLTLESHKGNICCLKKFEYIVKNQNDNVNSRCTLKIYIVCNL